MMLMILNVAAETKLIINIIKVSRKFSLSLHYDGDLKTSST